MADFFFAGSVEAAVQKAITDRRYLVAFVTDEHEESMEWENNFLPEFRDVLVEQAITLRLIVGSQGANYLTALFPMPKFPTIVVIKDGKMKEYLTSGLEKDIFAQRMRKALGISQGAPSEHAASAATHLETETDATSADDVNSMDPSAAAQIEAYRALAAQREEARLRAEEERRREERERRRVEDEARRRQEEAERRRAQDEEDRAVAERRRRLEEHRREEIARREARRAEQEEKARKAREEGEERRKAAAEKSAQDRKNQGPAKSKLSPAEQAHRDEVRRRQEENRKEHQRILARIESERQDRREMEEARRMNREEARRIEAEKEAVEKAERQRQKRLLGVPNPDGITCALQVRLFDGSLMRARFGGNSTLNQDVRVWVDDSIRKQDGGPRAYKFKWIQSPNMNATIDSEDEAKTVVQLGMVPTSTLVIIPEVKKQNSGLFARIWALLSLIFAFFTNILRGFMPRPTERSQEVDDSNGKDNKGYGSSTGIDRSRNEDAAERKRRQEQYYNGNSTAFESRPDDEEKS